LKFSLRHRDPAFLERLQQESASELGALSEPEEEFPEEGQSPPVPHQPLEGTVLFQGSGGPLPPDPRTSSAT
jgi:hypothetical protein